MTNENFDFNFRFFAARLAAQDELIRALKRDVKRKFHSLEKEIDDKTFCLEYSFKDLNVSIKKEISTEKPRKKLKENSSNLAKSILSALRETRNDSLSIPEILSAVNRNDFSKRKYSKSRVKAIVYELLSDGFVFRLYRGKYSLSDKGIYS